MHTERRQARARDRVPWLRPGALPGTLAAPTIEDAIAPRGGRDPLQGRHEDVPRGRTGGPGPSRRRPRLPPRRAHVRRGPVGLREDDAHFGDRGDPRLGRGLGRRLRDQGPRARHEAEDGVPQAEHRIHLPAVQPAPDAHGGRERRRAAPHPGSAPPRRGRAAEETLAQVGLGDRTESLPRSSRADSSSASRSRAP